MDINSLTCVYLFACVIILASNAKLLICRFYNNIMNMTIGVFYACLCVVVIRCVKLIVNPLVNN